ncbi:MAG: metallophosphoesterase family protein [Chloroflexota bacterium]|nr:metallophosphoesterase family protein [Chloroflexota bacterium]
MSDQIAVMADVHGNTWALDAVLADIRRREITQVVNLGDCVYGSLDPAGTLERLMSATIISIAGNQDREVFDESEQVRNSRDHQFVTSQLSAAQLAWLEQLPPMQVVGDIFLCHGTPASDMTYLLEHVTEHGIVLHASATILAELNDVRQPVVVCGHSHVPRTVWLPDGRLVVNPGSVGIPAYDEDLPFPHVMEAGSPHARYAVLTRQLSGWAVEHVALPYQWSVAADVARRNGRPDRARWIETGRA